MGMVIGVGIGVLLVYGALAIHGNTTLIRIMEAEAEQRYCAVEKRPYK